jgi:Ca-activated chloride channel family protein
MLMIVVMAMPVQGDGMIVVPRPPDRPLATPFPLEVKEHRVEVAIEDRAAVTTIDQVFHNPSALRLEGQYLFPVPAGAVINRFSMWVDGAELQAELLDAAKARKIYEDIVRTMRDPALLEYAGMDLFKVRIFPIEPHADKRVKISYREVLPLDAGTMEYLYPLNTEKFSSQPLDLASIRVDIRTTDPLRTVYCPTHEVSVSRPDQRRATVHWEARNVKPDADFKLYLGTATAPVGLSLLAHRPAGEDGFFFLTASPGLADAGLKVAPKDIVFVFDTSGSMAGEKLAQAKRALRFCIDNLNPGDRFEIVRFSTEAEALFHGLAPADAAALSKARAFIDGLQALGGTNIEEALAMALAPGGGGDRPRIVIFVTDGKPTIGETGEDRLLDKIRQANAGGVRIFTFGVGHDINTHLLDRLTEATRASRAYIAPEEDLEVKISAFYTKVRSPVLTDVKLSFGPGVEVYQLYPRDLPDLFQGSALTVFGRYRGEGAVRVTLDGKVAGQPRRFEFDGRLPGQGGERHDFIPPLWASRRIGFLLDQIRLHGEDRELVDEIARLARTYGIITPYTSHLIVEDERDRVARRQITADQQTLGRNAAAAPELERKAREEYAGMRAKSGAGSVQASSEVQELNQAANQAQTRAGEGRLAYKDAAGREQRIAEQVRSVRGQNFYQSGAFWNAANVLSVPADQTRRIQFGSKEYFELLDKEPAAAQYLSVGRNVRFALHNQLYEIYE